VWIKRIGGQYETHALGRLAGGLNGKGKLEGA